MNKVYFKALDKSTHDIDYGLTSEFKQFLAKDLTMN